MSHSILAISRQLIDELNSSGIRYCCWKEDFELDATLRGEDDVDLLVHREDFCDFERILASLHFKAAKAIVTYPWISHFYGLDPSTGRFLHLHIHLATITGESYTKEFHLPLETMILQNTVIHPSGCRIPQPEVQLIVFLLRYFIKISCPTSVILMPLYEHSFESAFFPAYRKSNLDRAVELIQQHLRMISSGFFMEMVKAVAVPRSRLYRIIIGLRLRRRMSALYRLHPVQLFFIRYFQIVYRCFNKSFLKRKKSLIHGGAVVAVTGLDGAGKSTMVQELHTWLGAHFDARLLHVGRPAARLETLPLRIALWLRKRFRRNSRPASNGSEKRSIIASIRYLVLAYERFEILKKAQRLRAKGYIVLCDRYPSLNVGKMDSPRLSISTEPSFLNLIARTEQRLYNALPVPDVIYDLRVPFEVALSRNRERYKSDKETDEELRNRHTENAELRYLTHHFEVVDSTRSLPEVVREVREKLWARL